MSRRYYMPLWEEEFDEAEEIVNRADIGPESRIHSEDIGRRCQNCGARIPDSAHPLERYCCETCRKDAAVYRHYLRRQEEQKSRPQVFCIRCKKQITTVQKGQRWYCPECAKVVRQERERGYYRKRLERKPAKRYCPLCGVEVRVKTEALCSRCRRQKERSHG